MVSDMEKTYRCLATTSRGVLLEKGSVRGLTAILLQILPYKEGNLVRSYRMLRFQVPKIRF